MTPSTISGMIHAVNYICWCAKMLACRHFVTAESINSELMLMRYVSSELMLMNDVDSGLISNRRTFYEVHVQLLVLTTH